MKFKNIILTILPYTILIFMFLAHINSISPLIVLLFIGLLLLIIFQKIESNLITLFVCLPFFNIINLTPGSTSFFYILLLIFILKSLLFNWSKITSSNAWIVFILIILLSLYNLFDINSIISSYIPWIFMFLFYIIALKVKNANIKKITINYTISYLIASALAKFALDNNYMKFFHVDLGYVYKNGEINYRFVGLMGETNAFAQVALILITLLVCIYQKTAKKIEKIMCLGLIAILILFSFLTVSKMFIIGLFTIVLFIILNSLFSVIKKKRLNIFRLVVITITAMIVIGIIAYNLNSILNLEFIQDYLIRFSAKDLSTGRFEVYQHFIGILTENPLRLFFGMGFKNYNVPWILNSGMSGVHAHNLILEYISLFGVISFIIILIYLLYVVKVGIKKKKQLLDFIPLLILLITGLSLHGIQSNYFYFCLFLITKNITD